MPQHKHRRLKAAKQTKQQSTASAPPKTNQAPAMPLANTTCTECPYALEQKTGRPSKETVLYVKHLMEAVEMEQTNRSAIASNFKALLRTILAAFVLLAFVATLVLGAFIIMVECSWTLILMLLTSLLFAFMGVLIWREVRNLTKADTYNMVMAIIAGASIILSIVSLTK